MSDSHTVPPHSSSIHTEKDCQFLTACGLPGAWAGQPQWRILDTEWGHGLHFLNAWRAWRADPQRPTLLHFVAAQTSALVATDGDDWEHTAARTPALAPFVQLLQRQWWGLLPGVHRLWFDEGQVLLTLHIGPVQAMLRGQSLTADSIHLHNVQSHLGDGSHADTWDKHTFKALARCCRRGTQLTSSADTPFVRTALAHNGFEIASMPSAALGGMPLRAVFNPFWEPRSARDSDASAPPATPGDCLVIGAGIAGAAAAASLARRGWRVRVIDQAHTPATGASGLPAGVFAPHVSPDDSVLSRLSRSGVRATLQQAGAVLQEGVDWSPCGVLERYISSEEDTDRTATAIGLPRSWQHGPSAAGHEWSQAASAVHLAQAGLEPTTTACWHHKAGWIRPARLVAALLNHPCIAWQGDSAVAQLRRIDGAPSPAGTATSLWQALDADGQWLAEAPLVVIATGAGSVQLLGHRWSLQPVRGQISWGMHADTAQPLAPFPVNGHGNLVPCFALQNPAVSLSGWVMGSTFERDVTALPPAPHEVRAAHKANWGQLQTLLPTAAAKLRTQFSGALGPSQIERGALKTDDQAPIAQSWAAIRCTSPDRLPIVGPVDAAALPGLWVCTAMGSRGLTLAVLCGELLAARLQGEPLPIDAKLAASLGTQRLTPHGDQTQSHGRLCQGVTTPGLR